MSDNPGLISRMLYKIGSFAVKYTGGISFDAISAGWYLQNGYNGIYSLLTGGMASWSGESVDTERALKHSVVWACNKIISETIGFIPAEVMQVKGDNAKKATDHPMYRALKWAPNDEITAQSFMETRTSHCVLQGNGYAKINRRSGNNPTAISLQPLAVEQVFVDREKEGQKRLVYVIKENGVSDKTYTLTPGKPQDILHIRGLGWDGVRGYSVITMGTQSIGSAIAAEKNVAKFWAHGGRKPYKLKMLKKFRTDEDFKSFRAKWEAAMAEPNKAPIEEPDYEISEMGMSMRDAQMIESRQFTIAEICRWFSISPHMVGDLSRATFSNIEHLFLQFLQMTLQTWINRWEQEFWRCILTPAEKEQGYELRFNVNELLRGDFQTRMEGYSSALQNGHLSIDEVREMEKRNALPNGAGKHHYIQLNMQPIDKAGEIATEKQPQKLFRIV